MRPPASAFFLLLSGLFAATLSAKSKPPEAPDDRAVFEQLKSLAGRWTGKTGRSGEPAAVEYRVGAGGTIVMETIAPGTPREMISVYFLDDDDLYLTHYCPVGNQPRMRYDRKRSKPNEAVFAFDGGRGFVARTDLHLHNGAFLFVDARHIETQWTTWLHGRESETRHFILTRAGN